MKFPELVMILAQPSLDSKPPPRYNKKVAFAPVSLYSVRHELILPYPD
jgi:hypothetical protein